MIESGPYRAVVVEVGGGVRECTVEGRPLLDGYAAGAMADGARGTVLAPWPNRLRDGRWTWRGRDLQLALSEPSKGNASHGLVRWAPWTLVERAPDRVVLAHVLHPQPGYPFRLQLQAEYAVSEAGLAVALTARNAGDEDAPVELGQHPYLAAPDGGLVDGCDLQVRAATQYLVDDRSLPTGTAPAPDLSGPLGDRVLDVCLTDLGSPQVRLSAGGRVTVLEHDGSHVQLFTGDTLAPDRRRRGLAVEPLTAPADAFRSGPSVLLPGEVRGLSWSVRQE